MSFKIEKFLDLHFATLTLTAYPLLLGSANIKQCDSKKLVTDKI